MGNSIETGEVEERRNDRERLGGVQAEDKKEPLQRRGGGDGKTPIVAWLDLRGTSA